MEKPPNVPAFLYAGSFIAGALIALFWLLVASFFADITATHWLVVPLCGCASAAFTWWKGF